MGSSPTRDTLCYANSNYKFIETENPQEYIWEHILRGDTSDGIPNFLSPDDTFVNKIKQKPIMKKKLQYWIETLMKGGDAKDFCNEYHLRNFQRNQRLIDFDFIPDEKEDDIYNTEEGLVFNPYNEQLQEITLNEVQCILNEYGINAKIYNIELYKRAFIHKSYLKRPSIENKNSNITIVEKPKGCISLKTKSNERLEFIGDGVLELITKYYLYRRFPKADEGFMTEKKIALVKNEHIGKLALLMKLNKWFIMSKNTEEKGTRNNLKKLGCLFEAFIGALFLDFNKISIIDEDKWFKELFVCGPGFQMAQIFVENILEKYVDWEKLVSEDDNFKNILQVKIQKNFKVTPDYIETEKYDVRKVQIINILHCYFYVEAVSNSWGGTSF